MWFLDCGFAWHVDAFASCMLCFFCIIFDSYSWNNIIVDAMTNMSYERVHALKCHCVLHFTPNVPPCFWLTQICHYVWQNENKMPPDDRITGSRLWKAIFLFFHTVACEKNPKTEFLKEKKTFCKITQKNPETRSSFIWKRSLCSLYSSPTRT